MDNIIYKQASLEDKRVLELIEKLNEYQLSLYEDSKCNLECPSEMTINKAFVIGALDNEEIIGIGAIKVSTDFAEVKRMYLVESYRGLGIADEILFALEKHASDKGVLKICLETGNKHFAAIQFYKKLGFRECKAFGNHVSNGINVFYEKSL